jgi:hypothetical protein
LCLSCVYDASVASVRGIEGTTSRLRHHRMAVGRGMGCACGSGTAPATLCLTKI